MLKFEETEHNKKRLGWRDFFLGGGEKVTQFIQSGASRRSTLANSIQQISKSKYSKVEPSSLGK